MRLALNPESVYHVVSDSEYTVEDSGYSDRSCTARGISRRMGYDENDPQVHALIRSMRVAGFIAQNALGGYDIGNTPLPSGRAVLPRRPAPRPRAGGPPSGRPVNWAADPRVEPDGDGFKVFPEGGAAKYQVEAPNDGCPYWKVSVPADKPHAPFFRPRFFPTADEALMFAVDGKPNPAAVRGPRQAPSGVPLGVDDELRFANMQQRASDQRLVDRLAESDQAGNLTSHAPEDACSLGLWHEGPCPDVALEEQLHLDDVAEDRGGMHGDDRETCGVHRCWATQCIGDPVHANSVTGYNWCKLHYGPVQRCGCWLANVSGRPLPGDEPDHTAESWVDWLRDPRVHSDGSQGGLSVDTRQGNIRVLPHPDGQWRVEGPYGGLRYFPSRHLGMLAAVDGEVHRDAVRRPADQRRRAHDQDPGDGWQEDGVSDAASWSAAGAAQSSLDEPVVQSGRRPRCTYLEWRRSQLVNLGSASRDEHFWQCPTTGCKVWAGPYPNQSVAKQAGFRHVYHCEKTDYYGHSRRPAGVPDGVI